MKTTPLIRRITIIFILALLAICAAIYWSMLDERIVLEKLLANADTSVENGLLEELDKMEHWLFVLLGIVGALLFFMWASILRFVLPLEKNIKALLWQKEQMMATMSHGIKTPLAKAKLALEFVADGKHKATIKKALSDIDALSTLMLANAEISAKGGQESVFMASQALDDAVLMLVSEDGIEVAMRDDFEIKADKNEFVLALKNLLENGLKHSSDGKVNVVTERGKITVSNKAPNFTGDMDKLAEPFCKSDTSSGHGLGLYIAKRIAEKWGFSLGFEMDKGEFVVTLFKATD
jgi:two-component system, OmpR family, sensor kinase